MAQTHSASPSSHISSRYASVSPRPSRSSLALSTSPPPSGSRRSTSSSRLAPRTPSGARSSESKLNTPVDQMVADYDLNHPRTRSKGLLDDAQTNHKELGNGGGKTWRDGSVDGDDGFFSHGQYDSVLSRRNSAGSRTGSVRSTKSPVHSSRANSPSSLYNGLPTLPTVPDDDALTFSEPGSPMSESIRAPPPASSTLTSQGKPVTRKRRSSSIVRKPSPGVTPTKAVDWEIPRKTLHSSIGFLTLWLYWLDPPTLKPLITVLSTGLVSVASVDLLRLRFPAFAEVWEQFLGFLMRESERDKINGVVWYLIGVIFVLGLYPRDVAVVSILTLSWSDTTASTIGRLWGKYTAPLPSHVPGVKFLPFAPRKSLAGFLAATFTGMLICLGFWRNGSGGRWDLLDGHWAGLAVTSAVVGVGGAVVEALDLGLDDNLTLPILSGALIWAWLGLTNLLF